MKNPAKLDFRLSRVFRSYNKNFRNRLDFLQIECAPDRRQTDASAARATGSAGQEAWRRTAPGPSTLRPRQTIHANRALKTVPAYLGRVTRDVGRKIKGKAELESFAHPLVLPRWVRRQRQHQCRRKPDPTACTLRSVFNLAPIA